MPFSSAERTQRELRRRLAVTTTRSREGLVVLLATVLLMWIIEVVNTLTSNGLTADGIYARNFDRLWGVLTAPFIHASFQHLFDNTIPFVFLGAIVALRGAHRLLGVTLFLIVVGGLGTWLISPSYVGGRPVDTIGASGLVFGYAGYLLARGFFNRRLWELVTAVVVAVIWGAVLVGSLVPHTGVSWQAHVCGGIAGVLCAWFFSARERRSERTELTLSESR